MLWLLAGIRLLMPFEIQSTLSLEPNPEPMLQQMVQYEVPDFTQDAPMLPAPNWQIKPLSLCRVSSRRLQIPSLRPSRWSLRIFL